MPSPEMRAQEFWQQKFEPTDRSDPEKSRMTLNCAFEFAGQFAEAAVREAVRDIDELRNKAKAIAVTHSESYQQGWNDAARDIAAALRQKYEVGE